ncbi:hypothetical protein A2U01_0044673, partial [Trifolium medium]|nr:hypothetical protein [Trifolium medium]
DNASDVDSGCEEDGVLVLDGRTSLITSYNKWYREQIIMPQEEWDKKLAEITAKINANDVVVVDRIARNVVKHLTGFVTLLIGVKYLNLKENVSWEDAAETNEAEERFASYIANTVMEYLTPFYPEDEEE